MPPAAPIVQLGVLARHRARRALRTCSFRRLLLAGGLAGLAVAPSSLALAKATLATNPAPTATAVPAAAALPSDVRADLLGPDGARRAAAALMLSTQDLVVADELRQLAARLLARADQHADRTARALAMSLDCRALYRLAREDEARPRCEAALREAQLSGDGRAMLIAERLVIYLEAESGQLAAAARRYRELLQRARLSADLEGQAVVLNSLGIAAEQAGAFDDGVGHYDEALQLARATGSVGLSAVIAANLGLLQNRMGEHDAAVARLQNARELAASVGDATVEFVARAAIAEAHLAEGRLEIARKELDAMLGDRRLVADERFRSRLYDIAARAALAAGDPRRATALANSGLALTGNLPFRRALGQLTLARAQLASGSTQLALTTTEGVLRDGAAFESLSIDAARFRAELLAAAGRHREAYEQLAALRDRRMRQATARASERLAFMRVRFESALSEQALALSQARAAAAEAEAERDRALRNRLVLAMIAALLALLLLWRLWAQREARESKRQLESQVAERSRALEAQLERRRVLEAELEQKRRLESVGRLTGGIAHDFNNLMTIVHQAADLVGRDPRIRDDRRLCGLLEDCAQAAAAGADISRQLVAFSRQQALAPQDWSIQDLLLRARGLLERSAGEDRVLEFEIEAPAPTVRVDASQLTTALINLVANARDATQPGACISIRVSRIELAKAHDEDPLLQPGRYVSLAVVDRGAGMSPETWQRAAEPFFTTKGSSGGTGLGLSMVHGFATQSGGGLRIATEQARGTTATIYLPAAA